MRLFLAVSVFLLFPVAALAHGNVLYNVSLDFDPKLRQDVIETAQRFMNTSDEPVRFDYDFEIIRVDFGKDVERSVLVHPVTLQVHGFRDDARIGGQDALSREQTRAIAEDHLSSVPEEFRSQLEYGAFREDYTGAHVHTWMRYVNDILVLEDVFKVEVDTDGVIAQKLSAFFYDGNSLPRNPAFGPDVAQEIALFALNAQPTSFEPVLVYYKDQLVWLTKVEQLYNVYVGVDALTGEVIWSGPLRGELPDAYSSPDVPIVESELIRRLK